ncbi:MAG: type II toxin-antitoxin system VapC family toxin [Dysgonamonadaceae bacterium]|jgi:tRNA(fMet)-specific endonuclease VapC|nr:type II toxin-antitoxin system VapC family toxin [Dysgonamonadaceae bacterium]
MNKYVLDTCICSYIIKGKSDTAENLFENIIKHEKDKLLITIFNHAELFTGVLLKESSRLKRAVEAFVERLSLLYFTEAASFEYAKIRSELQKTGTPLEDMDMLIAACCIAEKAVLVTNNTKHFSRIRNLKTENWTAIQA